MSKVEESECNTGEGSPRVEPTWDMTMYTLMATNSSNVIESTAEDGHEFETSELTPLRILLVGELIYF